MKRGYILLEAMIGGALLGTVLLALFGHIGDARAESTIQAREITAQQLLLREMEELRALPFPAVTSALNIAGVGGGTRTVTVGNGRYRIQRVVSGDQTERVATAGNVDVVFRTITVTVSFPGRRADETVTGITRIYRE